MSANERVQVDSRDEQAVERRSRTGNVGPTYENRRPGDADDTPCQRQISQQFRGLPRTREGNWLRFIHVGAAGI